MPKLKTMLDENGGIVRTHEVSHEGMTRADAFREDALTAHQQREVIRQLVEAIKQFRSPHKPLPSRDENPYYAPVHSEALVLDKALISAQPFLD